MARMQNIPDIRATIIIDSRKQKHVNSVRTYCDVRKPNTPIAELIATWADYSSSSSPQNNLVEGFYENWPATY